MKQNKKNGIFLTGTGIREVVISMRGGWILILLCAFLTLVQFAPVARAGPYIEEGKLYFRYFLFRIAVHATDYANFGKLRHRSSGILRKFSQFSGTLNSP